MVKSQEETEEESEEDEEEEEEAGDSKKVGRDRAGRKVGGEERTTVLGYWVQFG